MRIFWFAPALVLAGTVLAPGLVSAQSGVLPCAQLSMAQADDCPWSGTITLTRSDSGSTSTPIPATINDHGGTQTQTYSIHDVTTIQLRGDQATATRERTALNTITHHDAPGAQCGPGQGLSFGTHDTVDERSETQNGSAPVPVHVTVDPFGSTFSVQYAVPEPPATERHTYKEAWNICNAPKPQNVDQTATRAAGPVETYTFGGTLNPDDAGLIDGSHTDQVTGGATTTVTWHLLSACGPCDRYAQDLATQSATLMGDAQTAHDLLDQVADAAISAQPESPELSMVVADLQAARAQLDSQFSNAGVLGDPTNSDTQHAGQAYADALATWYDGSGFTGLVQLLDVAPLPQANGLPRTLTLSASPLTRSLQAAVQQLRADRATVAAAQLLLNLCQSGDPELSATSPSL